MILPIKVTLQSYFVVLLEVLRPVLKADTLEEGVLASILLLHFSNKDRINDEQFAKLLLSSNVVAAIREAQSPTISEEQFNVAMTGLRVKKLLVGNEINPILAKYYPAMENTKVGYELILDL